MARDRSDQRKRRGGAADRRRAQTYLAQLEWLDDLDGSWRRLDTGEPFVLDGAQIAKARRAARTMMREHASALPKLVGDVDAWWAIVDAKLAWCSACVAGGHAAFDPRPFLAPRIARALAAHQVGPMAAAAHRLATAWVGRPDRLERALAWLAARAEPIAALPIGDERLPVVLARLVVRGESGRDAVIRERGVDAAIALLAVDAPDPAAAVDLVRNVESRLHGNKVTEAVPPDRSRPRVVDLVIRLASCELHEVQRVLSILAEAQIAEALAAWQAWEQRHAGLLGRAHELAASTFDAKDKAVHGVRVIRQLEKMRAQAPVPVAIGDVLDELWMFGRSSLLERFIPAIVRLLAALPEALGPAARARMLLHVARVAATADDDEHPEWVWDALAAALADSAPLELLAPWNRALTSDGRLYIESDLIEDSKRRSDVQRVIRVMVDLAWRGKVGVEDGTRARAWLAAGLDEELVAELVVRLREVDGWMLPQLASAIVALGERTAADLAVIGKTLLERTEEWRHVAIEQLAALVEHAVRTGGAWIVRGAIEDGQGKALSTMAEMLALLPRSKWPVLASEVEAPWVARYPAALVPALRRLASVDPDAEQTAARRLADDVPDPAALRREIAALRERLGKPGAVKRLANLEARLASPKPPSPARLANLAAKLERAAREIGLSRFGNTIATAATGRIVRAFGMTELPAWASQPRTLSLLFALLSLDGADREIAGRLVRARCGPPPWDLRDEPANRTFLEQMRRAKVDPEPWLDTTPRIVGGGDGSNDDEPLTLALTGDPIEVFAMGAHFETCLSPSGGNFFSAVANAADINKRVIYAKRGERVVGRCLLALTDSFAILAFHVYSHEQGDLDTRVRDFALDLAKRMNTTVVPRGNVRLLVARDWYDDGPRDLVGRFRGLDDAGLDFATLDPKTLVEVLRAALGRDLDDVTLPIVLGHGGMRHRPELVVPLVPFVMASTVPLTRISAAELALEHGDPALADRLLGTYADSIRITDHVWPQGELLARLRPSYALARLRETRRSYVRSWDQEYGDRIAVAGVALEALHRPKQAAAMYRLAMRREGYLVDSMRARLAALGEQVETGDDRARPA